MITAASWSATWLPKQVGAGNSGLTRVPLGVSTSIRRSTPSLCGISPSAIMKKAIITEEIVTARGVLM